jgi:maleate cis-trans isomerase
MGHTHGIRWTDELVKEEIYKIMKALNIKRMPSRSEMKSVRKDDALSNKIAKTGGFRHWAKKLNLTLKECETNIGQDYEKLVKVMIQEKGYEVKSMTTKHPYDLLVNQNIKIDVKVARPYVSKINSKYHTFNLEKKYPTCDIYVFVCLDEEEYIERILIIPSKYLRQTQLSIGKESIYNKYLDKWGYIDKYKEFYDEAI